MGGLQEWAEAVGDATNVVSYLFEHPVNAFPLGGASLAKSYVEAEANAHLYFRARVRGSGGQRPSRQYCAVYERSVGDLRFCGLGNAFPNCFVIDACERATEQVRGLVFVLVGETPENPQGMGLWLVPSVVRLYVLDDGLGVIGHPACGVVPALLRPRRPIVGDAPIGREGCTPRRRTGVDGRDLP